MEELFKHSYSSVSPTCDVPSTLMSVGPFCSSNWCYSVSDALVVITRSESFLSSDERMYCLLIKICHLFPTPVSPDLCLIMTNVSSTWLVPSSIIVHIQNVHCNNAVVAYILITKRVSFSTDPMLSILTRVSGVENCEFGQFYACGYTWRPCHMSPQVG